MDDREIEALLDDLHDLLSPVVNTGASRDQLHQAVKDALAVVDEAYAELGIEDEDELEDDDEEDELEDDDAAGEGEEEPGEHVQL